MSHTPARQVPELPSLAPGITLLESDGRATGALQSIVLDELLGDDDRRALWVDAHGNARTQQLARIAPSMRVLERISVARAFTAFQHYSLVEDLEAQLSNTTAFVVLPAVDWFYVPDDLNRGEPAALAAGVADELDRLARAYDLPVLLSRAGRGHWDAFDAAVGTTLRCELTAEGPRFTGDDFETLVYHENGYVQTTLAYWRQVLADRHPVQAPTAPRQEVSLGGSY